ncbi:MAG TPA: hemerythrin domain-containing protein [Bacillota bacterium]|nr:hemerythrin domain-containing protein [Bacillota bacterium]
MGVTNVLLSEHEVILTMLGVLEEIAERLEKEESIDLHDLDRSVEFVKEFADRCHHGKEEDILFPAMEEAGVPKEGGPIGVMLNEHDLGRNFIRGLTEAAHRYQNGDQEARQDIIRNIHGYVDLLSRHIAKENQVLFQMTDQVLTDSHQEKLEQKFKAVQQASIGADKYRIFRRLAEELADKYLFSKV